MSVATVGNFQASLTMEQASTKAVVICICFYRAYPKVVLRTLRSLCLLSSVRVLPLNVTTPHLRKALSRI